ncbi:hypothetical protein U0C82_07355 [Fulvimarina sp. 2208YS6-2-32]|uniref:Uncharacterized protein n=1 Tax=Fulvimarina uroteuthidis TaxID=3098149 RepID=A0ABU5I0N8_9HYPH|nr:hypothetical protein [Fulvimarina sp. 2208YS6-2-32]MDY8108961.1 hypothetical protein [Fulvimarina sp. 2208YS6-2-32]
MKVVVRDIRPASNTKPACPIGGTADRSAVGSRTNAATRRIATDDLRIVKREPYRRPTGPLGSRAVRSFEPETGDLVNARLTDAAQTY